MFNHFKLYAEKFYILKQSYDLKKNYVTFYKLKIKFQAFSPIKYDCRIYFYGRYKQTHFLLKFIVSSPRSHHYENG